MIFPYFQITLNEMQVIISTALDQSVMMRYLRDFTTLFVTVIHLLLTQLYVQHVLGIISKRWSMVTIFLICHQKNEITYF